MHVRIRKVSPSTNEDDVVIKLSKITQIKDLQKIIFEKLNLEIDQQKLYYGGKELIGDHRIIDYGIKLNDVIQLVERIKNESKSNVKTSLSSSILKEIEPNISNNINIEATSCYYTTDDRIDYLDANIGAWFEAKILNIFTEKASGDVQEDDLIFKIKADRNVENAPLNVTCKDIRPRALYTYKVAELKPGMIVFVNYNVEDPSARGYWYDFEITEIKKKKVKGTLLMGREHATIHDCTIKFIDEIMQIEQSVLLVERKDISKDIPLRKLPLYCNRCKDIPTKDCKSCGCKICAKKDSVGVLILCDECDDAYHITCLNPSLSEVPSDDWYCPKCKTDDSEIVKAGEKLKISKKRMKMPSNKTNGTTRDWGKGMACVGRTKECTIVPKNHYGPIPGVEVGAVWKFRSQVSESGVHRPQVAGIHGREKDGAYSIVLSGGYEDDVDNGEEFYYTGSGGRDLSGNKRVNQQSSDQTLTRMNKALALNCNVKFNDQTGGEAKDWKKGKPVRVVRNFKLRKHSKYAPEEGNRYDGVYKVVKYFPVKGKSGFIVWRYLLRRDDPTPSPWTNNDQELDTIYPLDTNIKESDKERKGGKRKRQSSIEGVKSFKKAKIQPYNLDRELEALINNDFCNRKLWADCKRILPQGKQEFLDKIKEIFMCVCCQEVLYEPVTMTCMHNVCKSCLKRSFAAEIYVCPWCRFDLGKNYVMKENENLGQALKNLFLGYEAGR